MNCPRCDGATTVLDKRDRAEGSTVRRRRRCMACQHRFTTCEVEVETAPGRGFTTPNVIVSELESEAVTALRAMPWADQRLALALIKRLAGTRSRSTELLEDVA